MLRWIFKTAFWLICLSAVFCLLVAVVAIEDRPSVAKVEPPSAEDVVAARRFVNRVKKVLAASETEPANINATEAQLNSVMVLAARVFPGARGEVTFEESAISAGVALPLPRIKGQWINLSATIPAFQGEFVFSEAKVGGVSVPPRLAKSLLGTGMNVVLGNSKGTALLDAPKAMVLADKKMMLSLSPNALGEVGSNGILSGVFGTIRGQGMPAPEVIGAYYVRLREAMEAGDLPQKGSYLPYIQFTLDAAMRHAETDEMQNAYTAAIFALSLACGPRGFTIALGGLAELQGKLKPPEKKHNCDKLTLNGRTDSRLHFTTAATIQAASNRGVAVSMGEFKELYDTQEAGGFDFTDIAANNSGIRVSNTMMAASATEWPGLVERVQAERDVIVSFSGLPKMMSGKAFEEQYGGLDDSRYLAELDEIEGRIDQLSLHQP